MKRIALLLFAVVMVAGVADALAQTSTRTDVKPDSQSAKDIRRDAPILFKVVAKNHSF
jgi:hypothetical protein